MSTGQLMRWVDGERRQAVAELAPESRRKHAQYFTPAPVAELMASMIAPRTGAIRLLDPGAGVGVLTAAAVVSLVGHQERPSSIDAVAYEIDEALVPRLQRILERVRAYAEERDVDLTVEVRQRDFLAHARDLIGVKQERPYDAVVLNPPYGKVRTGSDVRKQAHALGVDVPNVYAAFWAAALRLTASGGDVVAITPRSFCNGVYFKDFRRILLTSGSIRNLHVFDSRTEAFSEQTVLQENLITHIEVGGEPGAVQVTGQASPGSATRQRTVPYGRIVQASDPERFIHVVPDPQADVSAAFISGLEARLGDLGVTASTGPVVDFRATELLRAEAGTDTVPLIYPGHMRQGMVVLSPTNGKKKSFIEEAGAAARRLLVPDGPYVLVKRFTAKEESRRVVASLYSGDPASGRGVGIENHLNYLHAGGQPLARNLAIGLAVYLNSSHVDDYLRQFSGHTQINAGDLRSLRYPRKMTLTAIGAAADLERLADCRQYDELAAAIGPAEPGSDTWAETGRQLPLGV